MNKFENVLLSGLFVFLINNFLQAETVQEIYQKQYSEPIENVIWGDIETTVQKAQSMGYKGIIGKPNDKITCEIPKVLITKNAIKFMENDSVKKELPKGDKIWTYLLTSPDNSRIGTYKAKLKTTSNEKERGMIESTEINILDDNGNSLLTKSFKGGNNFIISNDGSFVTLNTGSEGFGNTITFYDPQGNLIRQVKPFENSMFWSHLGTYSKSDKYIALSFDEYINVPGIVILYDSLGNELWRKNLNNNIGNNVSRIAFSPDERYIFISGSFSADKTYNNIKYYSDVLDINGKLLFSYENGASAGFSSDGDFLLLNSKQNGLQFINLKTGKKEWQYKDPSENIIINSFDVSNEAKYIVASTYDKATKENKQIILFNKNGKILINNNYMSADKTIERYSVRIDGIGIIKLISGKEVNVLNILKQ